MFLLFLFLILPSIFLIVFHQKYQKRSRCLRPPGPPGLPFIGNLHQFDSAKPHEFLWRLSKKYGPLMSLQFGCLPILVISSAKMAKGALKTNDLIFSGRPAFRSQQKLSYNAVDVAFSPHNEYWREMRKICILHLFSRKQVQSFRPIREEEVTEMIRKTSNIANLSSGVVNLHKIVMAFTSTIICRMAFGKRYNEDGHENKRFNKLLGDFQAMMAGFFFSDYFPLFGWVDKLSGMVGRLSKVFNDSDAFYQQLIDEHLDPNRPKEMAGDILDLLIQLKEEKAAVDLTWNHVKATLMNIFIAGSDTGAAAILWAMTALIKNPSKLKRVQVEIRAFMEKKGTIIREEDLQELHYLKAVIKETLRLFPPAPLLVPRETTGRCNIEGYEIEPKTVVYINAWAIARDPECWKNPDEFLPERFLNRSIDVIGQDFELIPFGAGRRGCPGISLGLATVEIALANLLHSFDWELPPGMTAEDIDTDCLPGLTMHKKNDLCLVAKKYAM